MARRTVEQHISYDDEKQLYYACRYSGKDEKGKTIKSYKSFKTLKEARFCLYDHQKQIDNGAVKKQTQITVKDWLEYWIDNIVKPTRQETTVYAYRNIINNHLVPELGSIQLKNLRPMRIQNYFTKKQDELSTNTLRKHYDLLNTAYRYAIKFEQVIDNPLKNMDRPLYVEPNQGFYTSDEMGELTDLAEDTSVEPLVYLGGYLGLRRGEIMGLKWSSVDFKSKIITVENTVTTAGKKIEKGTKTKKSRRRIGMHWSVNDALLREKQRQEKNKEFFGEKYHDSQYVICKDNGEPYSPNRISEIFPKFLVKHGLKRIKLHELRHSFATVSNEVGTTLFDAGKALGHSTPSTTGNIYTHLWQPDFIQATNAVGDQNQSKRSKPDSRKLMNEKLHELD